MKKIQPPFRPEVAAPNDTRNFDEEFTSEDPVSRTLFANFIVFYRHWRPQENEERRWHKLSKIDSVSSIILRTGNNIPRESVLITSRIAYFAS